MRKCFCAVLFLLALLAGCAAADTLSLAVTQVYQQENDVSICFDLRGDSGSSYALSPGDEISASLGSYPLALKSCIPVNTAGEGVFYSLVIDNSRVLSSGNFSQLKAALSSFINSMHAEDAAAVYTVGRDGVSLLCGATYDRSALSSAVNSMKRPGSSSDAPLYDALRLGISTADQAGAQFPRRHAVLAFVSSYTRDCSTQSTLSEISAQLESACLPLYVLGYGGNATALSSLAQAARKSGGMYIHASEAGEIGNALSTLQLRILSGYRAVFSADGLVWDGSALTVSLSVKAGSLLFSESRTARVLLTATPTPAATPTPELTATPSPTPTPTATPTPSPSPTPTPTPTPSPTPTARPTATPTAAPTATPIVTMTPVPTQAPTPVPTKAPLMKRSVSVFGGLALPMPALLACAVLLAAVLAAAIVLLVRGRGKKPTVPIPGTLGETIGRQPAAPGPESRPDALGADAPAPRIDDLEATRCIKPGIGRRVTFEIIEDGKPRTASYLVGERFVIGRRSSCNLVLADREQSVSSEHAILCSLGGTLQIRDNHSTNGLIINGSAADDKPVTLKDGDRLQLGYVQITVRL